MELSICKCTVTLGSDKTSYSTADWEVRMVRVDALPLCRFHFASISGVKAPFHVFASWLRLTNHLISWVRMQPIRYVMGRPLASRIHALKDFTALHVSSPYRKIPGTYNTSTCRAVCLLSIVWKYHLQAGGTRPGQVRSISILGHMQPFWVSCTGCCGKLRSIALLSTSPKILHQMPYAIKMWWYVMHNIKCSKDPSCSVWDKDNFLWVCDMGLDHVQEPYPISCVLRGDNIECNWKDTCSLWGPQKDVWLAPYMA